MSDPGHVDWHMTGRAKTFTIRMEKELGYVLRTGKTAPWSCMMAWKNAREWNWTQTMGKTTLLAFHRNEDTIHIPFSLAV